MLCIGQMEPFQPVPIASKNPIAGPSLYAKPASRLTRATQAEVPKTPC